MPTRKKKAPTAAPKVVRVRYSVPASIRVEQEGARHWFYAADRRGLRRSRPLVIDAATWEALCKTDAVQRMHKRGQILEVR